jgi:hypothetical protein
VTVGVGVTVAVAVEVGVSVAVEVAVGMGVTVGASSELVRPSWLTLDRSSFSGFGEQAAAKITKDRTTYQYLWCGFFVIILITNKKEGLEI